MPSYYTERLAAERLRACYDLAPPLTKAYLEAEIEFVLARTTPSMLALELGCGYGRVLERLLPPECAWRSELTRRRPASAWHWNIWGAIQHCALPAWTPFRWAFGTAPSI